MKTVHHLRCELCGATEEYTPPDDAFYAKVQKPCAYCWTDPRAGKEVECDGFHGDFGAPTEHHHPPHKVFRMPRSWMSTVGVTYVR